MISKADMVKHLSDLMHLEERMMKIYFDLSEQVHDPKIKELLHTLANDERSHKRTDKALIQKLKKS